MTRARAREAAYWNPLATGVPRAQDGPLTTRYLRYTSPNPGTAAPSGPTGQTVTQQIKQELTRKVLDGPGKHFAPVVDEYRRLKQSRMPISGPSSHPSAPITHPSQPRVPSQVGVDQNEINDPDDDDHTPPGGSSHRPRQQQVVQTGATASSTRGIPRRESRP